MALVLGLPVSLDSSPAAGLVCEGVSYPIELSLFLLLRQAQTCRRAADENQLWVAAVHMCIIFKVDTWIGPIQNQTRGLIAETAGKAREVLCGSCPDRVAAALRTRRRHTEKRSPSQATKGPLVSLLTLRPIQQRLPRVPPVFILSTFNISPRKRFLERNSRSFIKTTPQLRRQLKLFSRALGELPVWPWLCSSCRLS